MNKNSLISTLLSEHSDWRNILEDKGIRVKEDEFFYIFNYFQIGADFTDPVVQEARGIILDKESLSVACWPFRKFMNQHENGADIIDWSSARVQEKVDGSIMKCFFNVHTGNWQWATNGTIDASLTPTPYYSNKTFYDLVTVCNNFKDIDFDSFDINKTYIFELVSPGNRVIVDYADAHLYHIGTRSNLTGVESNDDIGIEKPKIYPITSLEECLSAAAVLNTKDNIEHEGFVVVDKNWHRVKIKSPEYVFLSYFAGGTYGKSKVLDILFGDDVNIEEVKARMPVWKECFEHYEKEIDRVENECQTEIDKIRIRFDELKGDRKAIAKEIIGSKYESVLFKSLGNNKSAKTLLSELSRSKYESYINDFEGGLFQ